MSDRPGCRRLLALAVMLSCAACLSGCMWSRVRINDPTVADRARAIRSGVTRAEDIVKIIGAQPTMRLPQKDYTLYGYTYGDTKVNGLVLILFNFTRSTTVTDTLYVEVDAKTGVVSQVYYPRHHEIEWRFWPFGDD